MVLVVCPIISAATYYLWTTRTMFISVDEPLSITDHPASFHVHPGQNKTLDITVMNSANINYSVTLTFALNDTAFQESYVTFSDRTYNVVHDVNQITAWLFVDKGAPPASIELTVNFYRE